MTDSIPHDLSQLIQPWQAQIPKNVVGLERHNVIGEIIESQPENLRLQLREILEYYLNHMNTNEASDIDLGGNGCVGRIWYRVHGAKKPWDSSPEFSLLETDFLCHNILMPQQRTFLLEHRNLDFSYSL
ncbi:MAG TPA: twitching motility protein PilT, partial [bacterium]|nr:twitching motility protein PilT [bacterium]